MSEDERQDSIARLDADHAEKVAKLEQVSANWSVSEKQRVLRELTRTYQQARRQLAGPRSEVVFPC